MLTSIVRMHSGCDVDVHAHINVLKLRVHQRVDDACAAADSHSHAGLEASRCDGDAVANLQCGLLSVGDANFRILNNARLVVREQEIGHGSGQSGAVVRGPEMLQIIQRNLRDRSGRRAGTAGRGAAAIIRRATMSAA